MMKKNCILFILLTVFVNAQTNFNIGYDSGYGAGYCFDQGSGCINPVPPISPIPAIGESSDNYKDGYNRGFSDGLNKQKSNTNSSESIGSNSSSRKRYKTTKAVFIQDAIYNPYANVDFLNLKIQVLSKLIDGGIVDLQNEDYEAAIEKSNRILKLQANQPIAYLIKSNAQFHKGEIVNAYNNAGKMYSLAQIEAYNDWHEYMHEEMSDHLKDLMTNNNFSRIQQICENAWYKNDLTNFYQALAYYYQNDFQKAKKYFSRAKSYLQTEQYLQAIKNNVNIPNPFVKQQLNIKTDDNNTDTKYVYDNSPILNKPTIGEGEEVIGLAENNQVIILQKVNSDYYKVRSGKLEGYLSATWIKTLQ